MSVRHFPDAINAALGSVWLAKRFRQPMPRGGHNWQGTGIVEGSRSLDVMKLARAGYLSGVRFGGWQWTYGDGTTASIEITGARNAVTLDYRVRSDGEDWQSVHQRVPIRWTPCRFGGARPWFVCAVSANGVYYGRQVAKLYGAGRLFACRLCYRLGYAVQRGGPMDQAHHRLARLHRKLGGHYDGSDGPPPRKPKWMRWRTHARIVKQIETGQERLDVVFAVGAHRLFSRLERSVYPSRKRRWTQGRLRPR
jgi:hypothetical protein